MIYSERVISEARQEKGVGCGISGQGSKRNVILLVVKFSLL